MRPMTIGGIILLLVGGFIAFRGLSYRSDRSVLKIGDVEAKVEERRAIPTWVGGVLVLGGIAMIVAGARGSKI
jgi:hypothetical protein